jgi:primary-amine oxidase
MKSFRLTTDTDLFSYEFYLDGSMQIQVQASGYISSAYAGDDEYYGYRVHDQISGAPHDHVINFKADFDILGEQNTLQLAEFVPVTKEYVWSDTPRETFHIERSFVESEDDGRMNWSSRGATQYNVINTDRKNRFGEYRGYRIAASGPTAHLTTPRSSNLREAIHPFTFDLAVTRRKDEELKSAHHYNGLDVHEPMVNFADFFDGESLLQEDLVLWFNLGMHHLPTSGDVPNTLFNIAHTSVQIIPVNFHERDPSLETQHRVRIDLNETTGLVDNVELFGQEAEECSVVIEGQLEGLMNYGQA